MQLGLEPSSDFLLGFWDSRKLSAQRDSYIWIVVPTAVGSIFGYHTIWETERFYTCLWIHNYFLFLFLFLRVHFPKLPLYLGWPLQSTLKTSHKRNVMLGFGRWKLKPSDAQPTKWKTGWIFRIVCYPLKEVYNLLLSFLWRRSTDCWWQKMKDSLAVTGQVSCNRELITCPLMYIFGERERGRERERESI